jgi:uncharacterized glyoxalase superfamily protein PhnB
MIDIFRITTPVYGTTSIEVESLIKELKQRLSQAKEKNKHFDWGCVRYCITTDEFGHLWLIGFTKEDAKEI